MKFNKQAVTESLNHPKSGKKVFTDGKKQNVVLSERQLDRLLLRLKESREDSITNTIKDAYQLIREAIKSEGLDLSVSDYSGSITEQLEVGECSGGNYNRDSEDGATYNRDSEGGATYSRDSEDGATYDLEEQGQYNRDPGVAAGEGLEVVINGIKKAYDMIKDSDTRKKLANSMTKLGNFMTITAELVGSGASQRNPRSYDEVSDDMPYPELDEEVNEGAKPDFLDLDKDGDTEESMKKASKEVKEDEEESLEESKKQREKLIQEEITRMKQIIKPISKI